MVVIALSKFVCDSSDEEDEDELIRLAALAKRRRLLYCRQIKGVQGPAGQKNIYPRFDWDTFFEDESPGDFRTMFRLSKDYTQHFFEPRNKRKANGNSGYIVPAVRFAVDLRLLAG